ncbi:hypothetical protein JQX08_04165 [Pseudomonas sp. UL073]|uniref:Uncharacterized protein n=1 Tax=Zestomonas insulae TaxID=2809017 RepID=A0ABS2I9T7_9GAMM|nr:hypothetical protein [Pseudomonas insulae]MBM7059891.1 hypothetical protein [Pseudomonas insulae]
MRINGYSSSYPLDRSARPGTAVVPYQDVQKDAELRREAPARVPTQPSQAGQLDEDRLPVAAQPITYQRGLSNQAAQALASYSNTASYSYDADAAEVLGLDLYA